jgi:hypothetical protein
LCELAGWHLVRTPFNVGRWWVVNIGVNRGHVLRGKEDSVVMSRMDVVKGIKSNFHMLSGWLVSVRRQKQVDRRKIRTSGTVARRRGDGGAAVFLGKQHLFAHILADPVGGDDEQAVAGDDVSLSKILTELQ